MEARLAKSRCMGALGGEAEGCRLGVDRDGHKGGRQMVK